MAEPIIEHNANKAFGPVMAPKRKKYVLSQVWLVGAKSPIEASISVYVTIATHGNHHRQRIRLL